MSYGDWAYPTAIDLGQGFTYQYGELAPSTPPRVDVADAFDNAPLTVDNDYDTGAGPRPPYWAASTYFIKAESGGLSASASHVHPARINLAPVQDTPQAAVGTWPVGATGIDVDGVGVYDGPFTVTVAWGAFTGVYPGTDTAVGHLARLPNSSDAATLAAIADPTTWTVLDSIADATPYTAAAQNVLYDAVGASATTVFTTTDLAIPLGVFTNANLSGHAVPATAYPGAGRTYGWYGDGAKVTDLTITRHYTPPRWRWIFADPTEVGHWSLRQRQTLTGSDSWPLRQRQNGHHSGSWPLRQRQHGV